MGTSISLHRGTSDHVLLDRRSRVLVFLKGSVREKAELRKRDPREYEYFENVWKVRQNHMDHTLPSNIFLLRCCGKGSCPHPLCKTRNTERECPLTANQVVKDASKEIFCICRQRGNQVHDLLRPVWRVVPCGLYWDHRGGGKQDGKGR